MRRFKLAEQVIEETAPDLHTALADAYRKRIRPLCLCREGGLLMYIAHVGDQYIVKRMPMSGGEHDPACPSYEPPDELSGLGVLMGSAIQVDPESGMSALKVSFSLTKIGTRAAPGSGSSATDTIAGDARKLSLRSVLHYLWHQAELTAWTSRWAGKRHWWNIRWHVIEAAGQMMVKGGMLNEILFVPEPFRAADKAAIEQRRAAALVRALPPKSGPRKLMILVGEVKDFAPTRSSHRLIVKHMPDFPFLMDERIYLRLKGRFENELALWDADEASHLMTIATFGLTSAGLAVVEDMALMVVAENWVPYDSAYEKRLVDTLAKLRDRSVKGLRYNLSGETPTAAALVQRQSQPIALYVVPPSADKAYEEALQELIKSRPEIGSWIWRTAEGEIPPLPFR
ncbi:DUF1173 domain-containing protein [Aminobacter sp. MDW-2]|uniref:DUF1173 domain-containing protein n=1 Tax=Aminobacter sp. MDW-2 TaxID=2666139 RepID=UPI0012AEE05E|nr:DUF1173 domain-containing protein [Aminobacter sp. MDW-2]MRX36924.1 DUF1173 family protein [Aminobacter sp. MDW-2]QNH37945.1 DUF1173 domain-containing protein [Aminobacter sp. MDW-2]